MKKILLSILSIFFCLGTLAGGALLLSGCDSSSYSENNPLEENPGGGNSSFDDVENDDDANLDDEDDNTNDTNDNLSDDEENIGANSTSHDFEIVVQFWYDGRIQTSSSSLSSSYPQRAFTAKLVDVYSSTASWLTAPTVNSGGSTSSGSSSISASYLSYTYSSTTTYSRYVQITATKNLSAGGKNWAYVGMDTTIGFSYGEYENISSNTTYNYNGSTFSIYSVPVSSGITGTVYLKYREVLDFNFYVWDSVEHYKSTTHDTMSQLSGVMFYPPKSTEIPSITGFEFIGWSREKNSGNNSGYNFRADSFIAAMYVNSTNSNLYAVYNELTKYTITYHLNSPLTSTDKTYTQTKYQGVDVNILSLSSCGFTSPTSYNFVGWATSSSASSATYDPGDTFSVNANRDLYAVWEAITYEITYHSNYPSGTNRTYTQIKHFNEMIFFLSATECGFSTPSGYSFAGWGVRSTSSSVLYEEGEMYHYNEDLTLYAVWERVYEITYHSNYPSGTNLTFIQSKPDGESVNILTISSCGFSTPSGYTFEGWATTTTGTVRYDAGDTYSTNADEDLYAVWEQSSYQLTINYYSYRASSIPTLNVSTSRGTLSSSSMSYGGEVVLTSSGIGYTHTVTISESTAYTYYIGTTSSPSSIRCTYTWSANSNASINIYVVQRYTITYYGNGGSTSTGATSTYGYKRHGSSYTIASNTFSQEHYTFTGWNTTSSGSGTNYSVGQSYTINANRTLYAQWQRITYTISFNPNGGEGTMASQIKNSGESIILNRNTFTRIGHTFAGWATSPSGGVVYYDGASYSGNSNATLYAVWLANNQAHYDSEGGYWYVEIGNMPQSKVDDVLKTTLSSNWASLVAGDSYYFAGMTLTSKVYNNEEYCEYNGEYYLVEPIKWRLTYSSNQTSGYGTTDDTLAIMATIVYVGQYSDVEINAGAGYSSLAVTGVLNNISETGYFVSETKSMPTFGTTSLNGTAESVASNIFVASSEEIEEVAGSGKIGFSDLVKAYLLANGKDTIYFTRDLGTNYNNIFCMNGNGDKVQYKAQNYFGVQFSVLVTEYACV